MSCCSRRTGSCATARIETREWNFDPRCKNVNREVHEGREERKENRNTFFAAFATFASFVVTLLLRRRIGRVRAVAVAIRRATEDPPAVVGRDRGLTDVGRLRV